MSFHFEDEAKDLGDGNIFTAQENLNDRHAPNSASDLACFQVNSTIVHWMAPIQMHGT